MLYSYENGSSFCMLGHVVIIIYTAGTIMSLQIDC